MSATKKYLMSIGFPDDDHVEAAAQAMIGLVRVGTFNPASALRDLEQLAIALNITMTTDSRRSREQRLREVAFLDAMADDKKGPDMVNHPPHYKTASGIEVIDVIEAFGLGFHLGNTVKYVLRAGKKHADVDHIDHVAREMEDLKKGRWYLDRKIAELSK